jgi:hypothetical protein
LPETNPLPASPKISKQILGEGQEKEVFPSPIFASKMGEVRRGSPYGKSLGFAYSFRV